MASIHRRGIEKIKLPDDFVTRYKELLGKEWPIFYEYIFRPLPISLRVNPLKCNPSHIKERLEMEGLQLIPIPGIPFAYVVNGVGAHHKIGNLIWHFLGYIYVQEAASMLPPVVLDPQPGEYILDLAAAPGSKTTQIAAMMGNTGVIVANDIRIDRISALSSNLDRLGVINVMVTKLDGRRMGRLFTNFFDKVLVDVPCSAEGTSRKSPEVFSFWSVANINKMQRIQIPLLVAGFKALKPGGQLVYSTCTLAPEENEAVISYLLEHYPATVEEIRIEGWHHHEGITEWQGRKFHPDVTKCWRLYPFDNDTEGFFLCLIRKLAPTPGEPFELPRTKHKAWPPDKVLWSKYGWPEFADVQFYASGDKVWVMSEQLFAFEFEHSLRRGLLFARKIKNEYKLTTNAAQLFGRYATTGYVLISRELAERFIRGEDIPWHEKVENGKWIIVRWDKYPLGIGSLIGDRIKNQLPRSRRVVENLLRLR
ncbi:NOL1/NOP2/sun family putative RNA methylase [candidate division WOR-3 bacterium]|nr:NOL1/NOP2/sun family putative RNA methylase [candidate division WOR-3 bacterium]